MFIALDVERGRDIRRHLAERVLRRTNVNRLPVAVKHQHNCLVQYVAHKSICTRPHISRDEVFVLCRMTELAASPGFAPGPPVSETGALLIMQRGKWSPGKVLPLRLLGVGQT